jgi:hypothetical protein
LDAIPRAESLRGDSPRRSAAQPRGTPFNLPQACKAGTSLHRVCRPFRPWDLCPACPGPPGRAVTLQAFGPEAAAPLELRNFDNFKDLELHLCRADGAADRGPKESNLVQANAFHRRDAVTRRDCGVGGVRERVEVSGGTRRGDSDLGGFAALRDKCEIFGASRGESNLVQAKDFHRRDAETQRGRAATKKGGNAAGRLLSWRCENTNHNDQQRSSLVCNPLPGACHWDSSRI